MEDLLEQEKREQQQQQPIPTPPTSTVPTSLPPGAQPISSVQKEPSEPSMVTMNPTLVTGQIVPNQPVGGMRPQLPGNLQPQRPSSATTGQTFMPRPPGTAFAQSQLPANQRMVNPRQPGAPQQPWPQRHPQEVTLQQRGPGNPPLPQGGMLPMQVPTQQQGQLAGAQITGATGVPQQVPGGVQMGAEPPSAIRPGLTAATGSATPPPPMSNTPAPPTPPENPQTEEDRLKVMAFIPL